MKLASVFQRTFDLALIVLSAQSLDDGGREILCKGHMGNPNFWAVCYYAAINGVCHHHSDMSVKTKLYADVQAILDEAEASEGEGNGDL